MKIHFTREQLAKCFDKDTDFVINLVWSILNDKPDRNDLEKICPFISKLYHYNATYAAMLACDHVLNTHGVEGDADWGYSYCNTGDSYCETLCEMEGNIFLCSWGDLDESLHNAARKHTEVFEQNDPTILKEWQEHFCTDSYAPGFYWWSCMPGCLPDSDPVGPFPDYERAEMDLLEHNRDEISFGDIQDKI